MAEVQVPVLNARPQEVTIIQGTLLGKVFTAEMATQSSPRSVRRIQVGESISPTHEEVIQQMVDGLPSEVTSEQREKVRELLIQYRTMWDEPTWSSILLTQEIIDPFDSH